jgi:hypothetical protein
VSLVSFPSPILGSPPCGKLDCKVNYRRGVWGSRTRVVGNVQTVTVAGGNLGARLDSVVIAL